MSVLTSRLAPCPVAEGVYETLQEPKWVLQPCKWYMKSETLKWADENLRSQSQTCLGRPKSRAYAGKRLRHVSIS